MPRWKSEHWVQDQDDHWHCYASYELMSKPTPQPIDWLFLDGKNLALRAFHAFPITLTAPNGIRTNLLHGALLELFRMVQLFRPSKATVICWEQKPSAYRVKIYPQYKQNRGPSKLPSELYGSLVTQLKLFRDMVALLPVLQWEVDAVEADDLLAYGVLYRRLVSQRAAIISTDTDFWQLVNRFVDVYNPTQKRLLTVHNFSTTGYRDPAEHFLYKCFKGDSADGIPGIKGLGEKKALLAAQDYQKRLALSLTNLQQEPHGDILFRNFQLMNLPSAVLNQIHELSVVPTQIPKGNWRGFMDVLGAYGLKVVAEQFSQTWNLFPRG